MTIRDIFGSLHDNVVRKIKNPFWGTFTIVFVIKNWPLFYSLLFFDSNETRLTRIEYIEQYINTNGGTWCILGCALFFTVILLISSYLFAQIGIFISHFAEAKVTPWVVKFATKGAKIVTKEQYDKLETIYQQTSEKLQEEKRKRAESDAENDKLQQKIVELNKEIASPLAVEEEVDTNTKNDHTSDEDRIVERIFDEKWENNFASIIKLIATGELYSSNIGNKTLLDFLFVQGILEKNTSSLQLFFTDLGRRVKELFAKKMLNNE